MPRIYRGLPRYFLHKASGQGCVKLNGRFFYLGVYGTRRSREEYDRLIREWLANGRMIPEDRGELSVNELMVAYLHHAERYYGGSGEYGLLKCAYGLLRNIYGDTLVSEFSPRRLKTLQAAYIGRDLCRTTINDHIGRVKRMFKWGVEHELVPPTVWHGLQAVAGLRKGRGGVREPRIIQPASLAAVEATLPHLSAQLQAVVRLQLLTGARPGELLTLRKIDMDCSGAVWVFRPPSHKGRHLGRGREILFGPRAQTILAPWMHRGLSEYLFQPVEAEIERNRKRRKRLPRNEPKVRKRPPGERYTTRAYRRAVHRACEKAEVSAWTPHQLRHNAATEIRKQYGIEMARIILGHSRGWTSEIYAERDREQALKVAEDLA